MKKLFTLIAATLLLSFNTKAQDILDITNFKMGDPFSDVFTTSYFKCVGVSTQGIAWAGTRYGGLYRYDLRSTDPFKGWSKSDQLTNVYINDIKPDNQGGIWVAQSGVQGQTQVAAHIAGGLNYFPNSFDYGMEFFSQAGTQTDGYLYSRNVKSLFINSKVPSLVWAVQGQSTTSSKAVRGGVNIGPNEDRRFQRNAGPFTGWDWGWQATPNGESIGGNQTGVWIGVTKSRGKFQIIKYKADGSYSSVLDNSNDTNLLAHYTPNAIHFDGNENKWIGLKYGGILFCTPDGVWTTIKDVDIVPGGFTINPNAITKDQYGNIYFGTTQGLLVYKTPRYSTTTPDPQLPSSYKLYTTEDGLSNNNITGLAYDDISGKLLMTSDAGVTIILIKPKYIQGAVFDVYTGLKKDNLSSSGLQKIAEQTATIKLILDGAVKESIHADATGNFELKKAEKDKKYTVEIEYTNLTNQTTKFIYEEVENRTWLEPTYIPDSLIKELKLFKKEMEERCFELKLFSLPAAFSHCWNGFYVKGWDEIYAPFYTIGGIKTDHGKKVENLANFFAVMKTVYDLGGNATEFVVEGMDNAWAFLDMVMGMKDFMKDANMNFSLREKDMPETFATLNTAFDNYESTLAKALKENIIALLKQVSVALAPFPDTRKSYDEIVSALNDGLDAFIEISEKGLGKNDKDKWEDAGALKVVLDQLKKLASVEIGAAYYKLWYAQTKHADLVSKTSTATIAAVSEMSYAQAYDKLINPNSESILRFGNDTLAGRKADVETLNGFAKMADLTASAAQAASYLALVPGFQLVGAALKGLSWVAKGVQMFLGAFVISVDAAGASDEVKLSLTVLEESGFVKRKTGSIRRDPGPPSQNQPVELLASKNNLNEKITAFQAEAAKPAFNGNLYAARINELRLADSAHSSVKKNTMNELLASADSAAIYIPGFQERFSRMTESFYSKEMSLKQVFFLQQYAMVIDFENKADYFPALDSTATEIKELNDSLYNNVERLINEINENGIGAPAYLEQSNYTLDHEHEPGSTGSVTYSYTNYGKEDMRNVSFKISPPTEGFNLTSSDTLYAGSIPAGQSRQFSFTFSSPAETDSFTVGKYDIKILADNGVFRNTKGSLIIINREALPVTLVSFEVNCSGTNTELSWETASESNSSHFEVEKSGNGLDWTVVRRVNAAGNSQVRKVYRLQDKTSGNSFYRLKQVDKDGKFTYSDVAWSKCEVERSMISVYPVPAKDVLHVVANASEASAAQLILLDITGREVRRLDASLQAGPNTIRMKTGDLSSGQYILRVNGAGINKTIKITISK